MNTAVINIKTQPETKAQAQRVAKDLGLSLSALINGFLKQFVKTKKVTFSLEEEPNEYFKMAIKKSREDRKMGKASPLFKSAKESIKWLRQQGI